MRRFGWLGLLLLAGCWWPPASWSQCVGTTCGSSLTTYLTMCRMPRTCNPTDFVNNLENNFITLDTKFAPTTLLEGHGHRGTNGDGPKLAASSVLDCLDSPAEGEVLTYDSATGQCEWTTGGGTGDVVGPAGATDRRIPVFDGATGKLLADSGSAVVQADGDFLLGSGSKALVWLDSYDGQIVAGSTAPTGGSRMEIYGLGTGPAVDAYCQGASTDSGACQTIYNYLTSSTANKIKRGLYVYSINAWNGTGAENRAIEAYATGGTENYAFRALAGDTALGGDETDFYFSDATNSLCLGPAISNCTTSATSRLHVAKATSAWTNALRVENAGAYVDDETGIWFVDTSTSSTASAVKMAFLVSSSGTWNGANALNIAARFAASGGTSNYGVDVSDGKLRVEDALVTRGQTANCADTGTGDPCTATPTITGSTLEVVCYDANSCDITLSETGIEDGQQLQIVCFLAGSGTTCDFTDSSGVSELAGDVSLGAYDTLTLVYAFDRWVELGRSDN